jgi:uncharacterized RDD family membrane protein YckC
MRSEKGEKYMSFESNLPYAAFHKRLGAFLIDFFICLLPTLICMFAIARPIIASILIPNGVPAEHLVPLGLWKAAAVWQKFEVLLVYLLSVLIPPVLYYAVLESSSRRATFGKMALGLATVRIDGRRVSFFRAFMRYVIKAFVGLIPFCFIALLPVFGSRRQAVHDWATGIVVVHRAKLQDLPDRE